MFILIFALNKGSSLFQKADFSTQFSGTSQIDLCTKNPPSPPLVHSPGGTDLEREYGDVRPWRPPFHASPAARKGPISSKRVSSQDPLFRKFGNLSLYSLNLHPNFSSQAPKFGHFQLTSPQIWKFSAHKPPFSEGNISSQAPHFGNPGRTPLPEKKLSAPPPGLAVANLKRTFKTDFFIYQNFHIIILHIALFQWVKDQIKKRKQPYEFLILA